MLDGNEQTRSFANLAAGADVSHYKIISKIGAGGMGEVYLAEDNLLERKVALKFLPAHLVKDTDFIARFKREAQATAKLNHPNIITIYEVGEHEGRPFFAMEYTKGHSLREAIKGGNLSLSDSIKIASQLCDGLQAAHNSGIVHRDIKPHNIMLAQDGRAKILDFGLAHVAGKEKLTKTGSTLGTLGYMSPEQIQGKQADERSDIFSLGVVMYEMITGRLPFDAEHEAAIHYNIVHEDPEPLSRYKSGVSAEVQQIIDKALAKDPSFRYQHADDFLTDLQRFRLPGRTQNQFGRQSRILVISLVALVSAIALMFVFEPWGIVKKMSGNAEAISTRIAIVPFENQTGDSTLDAWGRLISDWTSQSLMQSGLAEVISSEAFTGSNNTAGVKSLASATGATILVIGSYYRLADSVQFQAQIVGANEKLIHAIEPVTCASNEMDKTINVLRQRILGGLAVVLDRKLQGTLAGGASPPTYEAYQEFVLAFDAFHIRADWKTAIEHYEQAYKDDTTFLEPLIESCPAYMNIGRHSQADSLLQFLNQRRSKLSRPQQLAVDLFSDHLHGNFEKARDECKQLAQLLPGSHATFQSGYYALNLNMPHEAIDYFKDVNPDAGFAKYWPLYWTYYAAAYHALGEHKQELQLAKEGVKRFPEFGWSRISVIIALAALGRFDEIKEDIEEYSILYDAGKLRVTPGTATRMAAEELKAHGHKEESVVLFNEAIEWYRNQTGNQSAGVRYYLALTLFEAGQWDDAEDLFRELEKDSPDNMLYKGYNGIIAAYKGDTTRAMQMYDWLKNHKKPYSYGHSLYQSARIAAALGKREESLVLLKKAYAEGFDGLGDVHIDPAFEAMLDYPPLVEFLRPEG